MPFLNSQDRYGYLAIAFHWLTFLLMAAAFLTAELEELVSKESGWRERVEELHGSIGLLVLLMAVPRLLLHFADRRPPISPPVPEIQDRMAIMAHWALYALLFLLPATGIFLVNSEGDIVTFFGSPLPRLLPRSETLEDVFEEVHEFLANGAYAVIALHAGAALFHHYVQRDNTLRRMVPWG